MKDKEEIRVLSHKGTEIALAHIYTDENGKDWPCWELSIDKHGNLKLKTHGDWTINLDKYSLNKMEASIWI